MIANDIVDLQYSRKHKNFSRPAVLSKIFTAKEQQFIMDSEDSILKCCFLWSIKESAYKLYVQDCKERFFRPDLFHVSINKDKAEVTHKEFNCHVKTVVTHNYIFSEAFYIDQDHSSSAFKLSSDQHKAQSRETRLKLINHLNKQSGFETADIHVKKSISGIPSIYHKSERLNYSISLTHHGRFGAFSYTPI